MPSDHHRNVGYTYPRGAAVRLNGFAAGALIAAISAALWFAMILAGLSALRYLDAD